MRLTNERTFANTN